MSHRNIGQTAVWKKIFKIKMSLLIHYPDLYRTYSGSTMGKFKIVSENWTFGWFTSYLVVHLTLSMVVRVIFDKSEVWPRKSRFEFQNYQKLSLKISELGSDDSEIFFGGVYLDLEVLRESKKMICRRRRIRFTAYAI